LRFDELSIREGIRGYKNLISKMKLNSKLKTKRNKSIYFDKMKWLRAAGGGLFLSKIKYGDKIKEGDLIGFIKSPLGDFSMEVICPQDGYVVGLNNNPLVNEGDAIVHLGIKWSPKPK